MKLCCPFKIDLFSRENTEFAYLYCLDIFLKNVHEDLSLHTKISFPEPHCAPLKAC